ncbi:delta-60 repeat domain-containing protein, partial [Kitasatospora sp. NPDC058243]|uniref:delta-60 repeat domain-containing protein n=1 Tax=Kitasatospora sp. NPDC058243 TaxID=3346397 RepID=UPI0036DC8CE5
MESSVAAVAVQSDGRMVAAGYVTNVDGGSDFALVRYRTNGRLDEGFGDDGKVVTDFSEGYDQANGVAVQSDGRIVAAGFSSWNDGTAFALARYTPDGHLDESFGNAGKVLASFSGVADIDATKATVQADGRIVVAGRVANV